MKWLKNSIPSILLLMLVACPMYAQRLNCDVVFLDSKIETATINYLDELKSSIKTYLNEYNWGELNTSLWESIDCTFELLIVGYNDNNFNVRLVLRASRPIHGTLSNTQTLLISDESWQFNYEYGTQLLHDLLEYNPITTVLDFYAYMMIGWDMDSFSMLGGTPYYAKAQELVDLGRSWGGSGWEISGVTRYNRAQWLKDVLDLEYENFRKSIYTYHRKGLDLITTKPEEAHKNITSVLEIISDMMALNSEHDIFKLFFSSKYREIVSIYIDTDEQQRQEIYDLLSDMDSSRLTYYEELIDTF